MNYIVEMPESARNTVIWTVVDLFSKQAHFIANPKLPSARSLAKMFVQHVYQLHGVPKRIISDGGGGAVYDKVLAGVHKVNRFLPRA